MPNKPTPAGPDYTDDVPDFDLDDDWVETEVSGIEFDEKITTSVWHLLHCRYVKNTLCQPHLRIGVEKRYRCASDARLTALEASFFDDRTIFKVWYELGGDRGIIRKFAVFRDVVRDGDLAIRFWLVLDNASARISCIPAYATLKDGRKIIQQLYFEIRAETHGPIVEKIFKENPLFPAVKLKPPS